MSRDPLPLPPSGHAPRETEASMFDLWRSLRRRWLMLACVSAGITAVVMTITLLITPVFESEAVLRVREEARGAGMLEEILPIAGMSLPGLGGAEVETEIGILRSRRIADLVVDSVSLHVELTRPWRARRTEVVNVVEAGPDVVPGRYTFSRRPDGSYETAFRGSEPPGVLPAGILAGQPFSVGGMRLILAPSPGDDPPPVIRIRVRPFQRVVTRFRDRFQVARLDPRSRLIGVGYRHTDPAIAAGAVNAAIDYFLEFSKSAEQRESRRQVDVLSVQVARYEVELRQAEDRRQRFQEAERIIAPEEQASAHVRRIAEIQAAKDALEVERTALASLIERIASAPADSLAEPAWRQLATFPSFIANGAVQDVLQALTELENDRAELLGRRTEANEDVRVLDRRIAELQEQLRSVGSNYVRGLDHQIESATASLAGFDRELREIPAVEIELARLVREQELLSEILLLLQARLREAAVQESIDDAAARVIDYAQVMERAAFPRPLVSLVLASVLGLMAGLLAVAGYESANPHVRTRRDAEIAAPGVPLLGVVPPLGRGTAIRTLNGRVRVGPLHFRGAHPEAMDALVARSDPWHPASEAYRAIAGTLFGEAGNSPAAIVVTSALPDEGRARLAANLAIALARAGTPTILVDADLRSAEVSRLFGITADPGWPRLLLDGATLTEIVHRLPADDGAPSPVSARSDAAAASRDAGVATAGGPTLDLLPAGTPGPHPAGILGSPLTRALLAELRSRYTAVIIDTPPLQGAFDAATLGGLADGTVLVVRSGSTGRDALETAATDLRRARAILAGVVLTEHDLSANES